MTFDDRITNIRIALHVGDLVGEQAGVDVQAANDA